MSARDLHLRIDELVVEGLKGINQSELGGAVQGELVRLFAEHGLPHSLARRGAGESLDGGSLEVGPDAPTRAVGAQIGGAVYRGLKK